jgi:hypothetical protein
VTVNAVTLLGWLKMRSNLLLRRRVGGKPPADLKLACEDRVPFIEEVILDGWLQILQATSF